MSLYETLQVQHFDDGITVCTFNRPRVRNALNSQMVSEIRALLDVLVADNQVTALIFTGAGERAFVSGADINDLLKRNRDHAFLRINNALLRAIEQFPVPTIAAVRGYAYGGGCELAIACDLRVCGEGARFAQPETGLGIIPGAGACYRLPRLIGLGRAREMIFTGRVVEAQEALAMGLVNKVVKDDEVVEAALDIAGEIARKSRLATRLAKQMLNASHEMSVDVGLALEATSQAVLFDDEEKTARMQQFLKRRMRHKERRAQQEDDA